MGPLAEEPGFGLGKPGPESGVMTFHHSSEGAVDVEVPPGPLRLRGRPSSLPVRPEDSRRRLQHAGAGHPQDPESRRRRFHPLVLPGSAPPFLPTFHPTHSGITDRSRGLETGRLATRRVGATLAMRTEFGVYASLYANIPPAGKHGKRLRGTGHSQVWGRFRVWIRGGRFGL